MIYNNKYTHYILIYTQTQEEEEEEEDIINHFYGLDHINNTNNNSNKSKVNV